MFRRSFIAVILSLVTNTASAFSITVDGKLDEWLAKPNGNAGDWTSILDKDIKSMVEDDTGRSGYLNPGYGGQAYDAEAIYVYKSSVSIDIAIVTGLSPLTPKDKYPAGDIAIDFSYVADDPNYKPSFDVGVVTWGDGVGLGTAGDLYDVTKWNYGLWTAPGVLGNTENDFKKAHPTSIADGAPIHQNQKVALAYSQDPIKGLGEYVNDEHYVIETSIPLALLTNFNTSEPFLVHWTMACANDYVQVDPPGSVPAPAPLGLMILGLLPLLRHRLGRA
jgi:hypothetical protein